MTVQFLHCGKHDKLYTEEQPCPGCETEKAQHLHDPNEVHEEQEPKPDEEQEEHEKKTEHEPTGPHSPDKEKEEMVSV